MYDTTLRTKFYAAITRLQTQRDISRISAVHKEEITQYIKGIMSRLEAPLSRSKKELSAVEIKLLDDAILDIGNKLAALSEKNNVDADAVIPAASSEKNNVDADAVIPAASSEKNNVDADAVIPAASSEKNNVDADAVIPAASSEKNNVDADAVIPSRETAYTNPFAAVMLAALYWLPRGLQPDAEPNEEGQQDPHPLPRDSELALRRHNIVLLAISAQAAHNQAPKAGNSRTILQSVAPWLAFGYFSLRGWLYHIDAVLQQPAEAPLDVQQELEETHAQVDRLEDKHEALSNEHRYFHCEHELEFHVMQDQIRLLTSQLAPLQEAQQEVQALQEQNAGLQRELEETHARLDFTLELESFTVRRTGQLQQEIQRLHQEMAKLRQALEETHARLDSALKLESRTGRRTAQLQQEIAKLQQEIAKLQQELREEHAQMDILEEKHKKLKRKHEEAQRQYEELSNEHQYSQLENESERGAMQARTRRLTSQLTRLQDAQQDAHLAAQQESEWLYEIGIRVYNAYNLLRAERDNLRARQCSAQQCVQELQEQHTGLQQALGEVQAFQRMESLALQNAEWVQNIDHDLGVTTTGWALMTSGMTADDWMQSYIDDWGTDIAHELERISNLQQEIGPLQRMDLHFQWGGAHAQESNNGAQLIEWALPGNTAIEWGQGIVSGHAVNWMRSQMAAWEPNIRIMREHVNSLQPGAVLSQRMDLHFQWIRMQELVQASDSAEPEHMLGADNSVESEPMLVVSDVDLSH